MNDTENTITMSGEKLEVLIGAGCLTGCTEPEAAKLPSLISDLCKKLTQRSVARYFIRKIRIGDTVALVDRTAEYTYRLKVTAHAIVILSISKQIPTAAYSKVPVLILVNTRLLQAINNEAVAAA